MAPLVLSVITYNFDQECFLYFFVVYCWSKPDQLTTDCMPFLTGFKMGCPIDPGKICIPCFTRVCKFKPPLGVIPEQGARSMPSETKRSKEQGARPEI